MEEAKVEVKVEAVEQAEVEVKVETQKTEWVTWGGRELALSAEEQEASADSTKL